MPSLGPMLHRRHQLRNLNLAATDGKLEGIHLDNLATPVETRWHPKINELLDVLGIVWSHAVANRPSQLIVNEVTSINFLNILRAAIEHEVEMVSTAVTSISRFAHQILTEKLGQNLIRVIHA